MPTTVLAGAQVSPSGVPGPSLGTPVGVVLDYAGNTEPTGFLFCDGRAVSQSTYAALFSVIGSTFVPSSPTVVNEKSLGVTGTGTTVTLPSVVVSGTNRLLLVWVMAYNGAGNPTVSTVKFNGVSLTKLTEETFYSANGNITCWYLLNPAAVTGDVVITNSIGYEQGAIIAQVYNEVHQTTPLGTPVSYPRYAGDYQITIEVPSVSSDLIVDCLGWSSDVDHTSLGREISVASYASGYLALRSSIRLASEHSWADTDTTSRCQWNAASPEGMTLVGVTIKSVGSLAGMFYLPDLRGRIIAGCDNMGGFSSGRMGSFTCYASTLGTTAGYEYIYNVNYGNSKIQVGMQVTGPGIPANTFVLDFYSLSTVHISKLPTSANWFAKYNFFFADMGSIGAAAGYASHVLIQDELAYHSHLYTNLWTPGSGLAGGPNVQATNPPTSTIGKDRPHNNLQPTMIMNKIIKF